MAVYISVVSHGHGGLIKNLDCLRLLSSVFSVVVKINESDQSLVSYLKCNGICYIDNDYGLGFGHNNNLVFNFCKKKLGMNGSDYYIVLNPDVVLSVDDICNTIKEMSLNNLNVASVNLYKDSDFLVYDNSIRKFPSLLQFVRSFLGGDNTAIVDKSLLEKNTIVDWAAGSFLAFRTSHYENLRGFDENYFMYCEDIDICYRSSRLGVPVVYLPQIKIQHLAKHANRSIFSRHFFWHVKSVFRFLLSTKGLTKIRSSLL